MTMKTHEGPGGQAKTGGALAATFLMLCALAAPARAQFVVSDPTNLVQNTISAASEAETTLQQIRSVIMQAEQLRNQIQDLEKLDIQNLRDLKAAYAQVAELVDRSMRLAGQWRFIADNFGRIYGEWAPREYEGAAFWAARKTWEDNTDMAYKQHVKAQADVGSGHARLYSQVQALDAQSQSIRGTVAATEMATKTLGVISSQNALLLELELANARAEAASRLESRRKAEAARLRQLDRIGRGFGQIQSTADPVELKDF
jgi:P-type conjugative transfer protein TrbJ